MRKKKAPAVVTQTEEKAVEMTQAEGNAEGTWKAENIGKAEGIRKAENIGKVEGAGNAEGTGKAENTGRTEAEETVGKAARRRKNGAWIYWGLLVSAALALVLFCMYGFFRDRAEETASSSLEEYSNITWLYQNCFLLYRDLYNAQTGEQNNYKELYVQLKEGYEWILEADAWDETVDEFTDRYESIINTSDGEVSDYYTLRQGIWGMEEFFRGLENNFSALNGTFGYVIRDNDSGFYLTNMSEEDLNIDLSNQFFQVGFTFNEYGSVAVADEVAGRDTARIRKYANEAVRSMTLDHFLDNVSGSEIGSSEIFSRYGTLRGPVNCTVIFRILKRDVISGQLGYKVYSSGPASYHVFVDDRNSEWVYRDAHMGVFLIMFLTVALACGVFLPVLGEAKPWREVKMCRLPLEPLLAIGTVVFGGLGSLVFKLAVYTASGSLGELLDHYMVFELAYVTKALINIVCLTAFFFCGWYLGICARAVRDLGIKEYIKQKCIFYRIFPFVKGKALAFYDEVCHFDVTRDANKIIWKIVLLNALILFVISCFWVTGFPLTLVYSLILYVILRNYISKLQKKYGQLLHATNEIAEGNLNVKITEDLGVFEPFKPQILRIQNGFKSAVEEETKSQRMKAELITNVSHDLKTPLTAIITYINLLKEENITEEQRREYLDTLERKSLRLKVLIEDLFEVSKANSQTVTLNIMDVDIMNLVKQVAFEMSDKLEASGLDVRINLTDEKVILPLDSQKTYRIYENLMGNIAKYALPGTRVYINGFRIDDTVIITMKNISAQEITVETSELTERFVRGDASRNTEGSGLGLAIAKGFMELQGGELSLEVDGDLFKAVTTWHVT